jgi:hypothetical protein
MVNKSNAGRPRKLLYNKVHRIRVTSEFRDLLPFFQMLDKLPADRRNAALLSAIRGGAASAQKEAQAHGKTSAKMMKMFENIAGAFDTD